MNNEINLMLIVPLITDNAWDDSNIINFLLAISGNKEHEDKILQNVCSGCLFMHSLFSK